MPTDYVYVVGSLSFIVLIMVMYLVTSQLIITKQQRTIDKLTDKLMARSYSEYKSLEGIKEDDVSPVVEEESKGWHDRN